jgi:hypothetical protein
MSPRRSVETSDDTTIVRAPKVKEFVRVLNAVFADKRLSWEARGLLGYLLSKPDNWTVRMSDLIRQGPAGYHKVRRIVRELEKWGYMRRRRIRRQDGTFTWGTVVYEDPDGAAGAA